MQVVKVKPWSDDQGDYVIIDAANFDPAVHVAFVEGPAAVEGDDLDALKAKIAALGGSFHHKAGAEKLAEALNAALDATHDDAGGLSHRELNADLESAGVEFDPLASPAAKFALLNSATGG